MQANVTLNWIAKNITVSSFYCVWTNDRCLIEFLVMQRYTWNDLTMLNYAKLNCLRLKFEHLTVCKQMTDVKLNY